MSRWNEYLTIAIREKREIRHVPSPDRSHANLHWRLSCRWACLDVESRHPRFYRPGEWWRLDSPENKARYLAK